MKLTIKDLNCGNCPVAERRNSSEYPFTCTICKPIPTAVHKYVVAYQHYFGCASHPMALQVLAGSVIVELEKTIKTNSRWPKLEPYYEGVNAMCENTIKLLKEGVKK